MWKVWDRISNINNQTAEEFLKKNTHLQEQGSPLYLKETNGIVIQVENKAILARVYDIDYSLDDETFIQEYQRRLEELNQAQTEFSSLFGTT